MKEVCAWCGQGLDLAAELNGSTDQVVTRGICASCVRNTAARDGVSLQTYLDALDLPVLVVDASVAIRSANRAAASLLGRAADRLEGLMSGEVFECENARLPGGCGRTVHCSGCAIRMAVHETWITSVSQVGVPATITADPRDEIAMAITTEKFGEFVLLRIDETRRRPRARGNEH